MERLRKRVKDVKTKLCAGRKKKSGHVYVIEEERIGKGDCHFYKFGQSGNPHRRMRQLQTGNPRKLSIFVESDRLEDCVAAEQYLKITFKEYRCPREMNGGTEWFMVEHDENSTFQQKVWKEIRKLNSLNEDSSDEDSSDEDSLDEEQ